MMWKIVVNDIRLKGMISVLTIMNYELLTPLWLKVSLQYSNTRNMIPCHDHPYLSNSCLALWSMGTALT